MDMVKCDRCGLIGKRDRSWGTVIVSGSGEPRVKYDTCSGCRRLIKDIIKEGIKVGENAAPKKIGRITAIEERDDGLFIQMELDKPIDDLRR
jgi:hypothetical protein